MIDFKKIAEIMCWDVYDGETAEDVFVRKLCKIDALPSGEIIDIVYSGGLQKWAEMQIVTSEIALYNKVLRSIRKTTSEPVFQDKKRLEMFPPLANFFYYCQKLDRSGKTAIEAEAVADIAWNGVIQRRNLEIAVAKLFSTPPDKSKFDAISKKIREIWGFSAIEIDALRYFVCQTRHTNHNPSMNKNIYLWGKAKQTGKTTIARAIVTILNGAKFSEFGKFESTFATEMAFNDHDLPLAASYNAVLLDEAMPKDSKKSYGNTKRMLTSNSVNYNPKFRQIVNLVAKRFYFFTSNDDIQDYVQDATERRFFAINIERKPVQMSFDEIYNIWLEFCVNAVPEPNWQEWYDSFDFVSGLATKDLEEVISEIVLYGQAIFSAAEGATYITAKKVADKLFKNEPTREQKKTVGEAMEKLFANCRLSSNKSYFTMSSCRAEL